MVFTNSWTYAQQEIEQLEVSGLGTTFIVVGSVGDVLTKGKCPCSVSQKGRCTLFEFEVHKVLFCFENNVFSEAELSHINRILIQNKTKFNKGKKYIISLQPGTSNLYVQYTDTLVIDPTREYKVVHKDGYISNLINCGEKKDRFNEFILKQK